MSTHDAFIYLVVDVHQGDPSPLVRFGGVAFLGYRNYLAFVPFVKVRLAIPELVYNSRSQERFVSSSALNELGGTPFGPGELSFANFMVDLFISSHDIG